MSGVRKAMWLTPQDPQRAAECRSFDPESRHVRHAKRASLGAPPTRETTHPGDHPPSSCTRAREGATLRVHRAASTAKGSCEALRKHEQLDAAADVDLRAGDVRGEVGAEKRDGIRARPPARPGRRNAVRRAMRSSIARIAEAERLRRDDPRNDRVGSDPVPRAFERERLRQPEQARLRRCSSSPGRSRRACRRPRPCSRSRPHLRSCM